VKKERSTESHQNTASSCSQSFLFLGDGHQSHDIPSGALLVLNREDRKIFDAFENAGAQMTDSDIAGFCSQMSIYRLGMDVRTTFSDLLSSALVTSSSNSTDGFLVWHVLLQYAVFVPQIVALLYPHTTCHNPPLGPRRNRERWLVWPPR
jgi:hypothetical protein